MNQNNETPANPPVKPVTVDLAVGPSANPAAILSEINLSTGEAVDPRKQRHFLAAFFFSFIFGVFGVDRFYLGKYFTGFLKLLTFGGLGVWALIDLNLIISGSMRDKQGNKLLDAEKYKKFASKTVLIFTLVTTALLIVVFASSAYIVMQIMQNGELDKTLQMMQGGSSFESLYQ